MNKNFLGIVSSLAVVGFIAIPMIHDSYRLKVIFANYVDVSDSNQKNQSEITSFCRQFLDRLKERDYLIKSKFANLVHLESSNFYETRNFSKLYSECDQASHKPKGIGLKPGTDLVAATTHLATQIEMARVRGQIQPVRASILIDSDEPIRSSHLTSPKQLEKSVDSITKDGGKLVIVISEDRLQQEIIKQLSGRINVKICPWQNAESCGLDWLMDR
jgi:hypothetical protein